MTWQAMVGREVELEQQLSLSVEGLSRMQVGGDHSEWGCGEVAER